MESTEKLLQQTEDPLYWESLLKFHFKEEKLNNLCMLEELPEDYEINQL